MSSRSECARWLLSLSRCARFPLWLCQGVVASPGWSVSHCICPPAMGGHVGWVCLWAVMGSGFSVLGDIPSPGWNWGAQGGSLAVWGVPCSFLPQSRTVHIRTRMQGAPCCTACHTWVYAFCSLVGCSFVCFLLKLLGVVLIYIPLDQQC